MNYSKRIQTISKHYNLPERYWKLMGVISNYSCPYYGNGAKNNEEASKHKWDLWVKDARIKEGMKVLDMGCGWGHGSDYIQKKTGCIIYACNVSSGQIEYMRKNFERDNFIILPHSWEYLTEIFDAIISDGNLVHQGYRWKGEIYGFQRPYIQKLYDQLNPGGRFILKEMHYTKEDVLTYKECVQIARTFDYMGWYRVLQDTLDDISSTPFKIIRNEAWPIEWYIQCMEEWIDDMIANQREMWSINKGRTVLDQVTWEAFIVNFKKDAFDMREIVCEK